MDDFSRRAVAEAFARSIIQVIHDHGKMFVTDLREVSVLGEVSTQQPLGILVEPALPSAVRVGEEHAHPTRLLNLAELGKLLTVVQRQRPTPGLRNAGKVFDVALGYSAGAPIGDLARDQIAALAFDLSKQASA